MSGSLIVFFQSQGSRPGPRTVLSKEMEAAFARSLITLADKGFGLTKRLVLFKAADFCRQAKLNHPFKDGPAGQTWYRCFMKRHPELSLRSPSKLCTARGRAMNKNVIMGYFHDVQQYTEGVQNT